MFITPLEWKNHNYELVITEDGSPSLKWADKEIMHHKGGAYSETFEIYGGPIRETLKQGFNSFVSVGLGLGYNELMVASEAIKFGIPNVRILSYESDDFLKNQFLNFLAARNNDQIFKTISEFFEVPFKLIADFLLDHKQRNLWELQGALNSDSICADSYHCILYDAFSSKTSPELWSEEFLNSFLKKSADSSFCLFSTYACTGALKRALKSQGFDVQLREGFHGKRNSTLGVRK